MNSEEKKARIFKVLSVDTRIKIIELLKKRSFCVNALSRKLKVTPAAVSQHLRILRDAEVVIAEKKGYYVHYRINEQTMTNWFAAVKELLE
ncbi:MAG: ArsR/SmtB family transcription factor [Thermotogota bacterium]